ncbi:MAG TPA: hypothetical protein VF618_09840 [Thermoanaerobaculia bacterium]
MLGSAIVYSGLAVAVTAAVLRKPRIIAAGVAVTAIGLFLPTRDSHAPAPGDAAASRLDEFAPAWQFNEVHELYIDAPPERVFAAIREVRADEIFAFRALTWLRRGGRDLPQNILNAGGNQPLLDVAVCGGFVYLAVDAPREVVVGTAVIKPRGFRETTIDTYRQPLPRGIALGTMNFRVIPEGTGSRVTTETRVFANSSRARRRFAAYWRIIYPGSAFIRLMWLRAIERRATG